MPNAKLAKMAVEVGPPVSAEEARQGELRKRINRTGAWNENPVIKPIRACSGGGGGNGAGGRRATEARRGRLRLREKANQSKWRVERKPRYQANPSVFWRRGRESNPRIEVLQTPT